jgi:hypothetical protein
VLGVTFFKSDEQLFLVRAAAGDLHGVLTSAGPGQQAAGFLMVEQDFIKTDGYDFNHG